MTKKDFEISNSSLLSNPGGPNNPVIPKYVERRDVILWRAPGIGYIEMYINPQQIRIDNKKIAQSTRTKAGFIYQYAGEDLTQISIDGTTGSSGIEGINLLEKVYRAEQLVFNGFATQLDSSAQALPGLAGAAEFALGGLGQVGREISSFLGSALLPDIYNQPFPTLASLAAAVEMNHQGVVYRGYFESFGFTENAQTPGLFDYSIRFVAYSKLGERHNFMPWHRTPHQQSDSSSEDNFSFLNIDVGKEAFLEPEEAQYAKRITPKFQQSPASEEFIKNNEGPLRSIIGNGIDLTRR
jgi:hypothetical protein